MSKSEHPKVRARFAAHLRTNVLLALSLLGVSLLIGMAGYHWLGPMSWLDAFVNASMLLGGMGPVNNPVTAAGKVFASLYEPAPDPEAEGQARRGRHHPSQASGFRYRAKRRA